MQGILQKFLVTTEPADLSLQYLMWCLGEYNTTLKPNLNVEVDLMV